MSQSPPSSPHSHTLRRCLMVLVGVIVFGTVGFELTEGWGLWDSFFFTVVTITTVGYGDYGLSVAGEQFAAMLMLVGIGTLTYCISQIVQAAIELSQNQERRMHRAISNLNDHVIVCGVGRFGTRVCEQLDEAGAAFVAIDQDPEAVATMRRHGWIVLEGDATDDGTLIQAGIHHARALVSVSSRDADNIVVTLSAHSIAPELEIFSRAEHEDSVRKIKRAGASHVISPVLIGGQRIAEAILNPSLSKVVTPLDEAEHGVRLFEIQIEPGSPLVGRTIQAVGIEHTEVVFVSMTDASNSSGRRPQADEAFAIGQTHVIAGSDRSIQPFLQGVARRAA